MKLLWTKEKHEACFSRKVDRCVDVERDEEGIRECKTPPPHIMRRKTL
jgi:hypothetical protein